MNIPIHLSRYFFAPQGLSQLIVRQGHRLGMFVLHGRLSGMLPACPKYLFVPPGLLRFIIPQGL